PTGSTDRKTMDPNTIAAASQELVKGYFRNDSKDNTEFELQNETELSGTGKGQ
ncbi:UNVERIFIED_CONTAM: hypothetical protein K2H54_016703, partial [Gekko kuhli]